MGLFSGTVATCKNQDDAHRGLDTRRRRRASTSTRRKTPGAPENRGSNLKGTYLPGRGRATWAPEPGPPGSFLRSWAFGTGGIARGPLGVPPGRSGDAAGYRGVRILSFRSATGPPRWRPPPAAAGPRAPRWGRREVLRQAVPGGPRCCEKRIPGKPRPTAAEGPAARRRGCVRSRGRGLSPPPPARRGSFAEVGPDRGRRDSPSLAGAGYRPVPPYPAPPSPADARG